MRIEIERKSLKTAVTRARFTTARTGYPILKSLLLSYEGSDALSITSTDLEVTTRVSLKGHVAGDAFAGGCDALCVDAKSFAAALGTMSGEYVTIECDEPGGAMALRSNGLCRSLPTAEADEFPMLPDLDELQSAAYYSSADFRRVVECVLPAASRDQTRYNLNAVYLESPHGETLATAMDGRRLAQCRLPDYFVPLEDQVSGSQPQGVMIPLRAVEAIGRAMGKSPKLPGVDVLAPEEIDRCASGHLVAFRYGNVTVTARVIDGDYPNYRQVIPKNGGPVVSIEREPFIAACKALEGVNPRNHAVRLDFLGFGDGGVRFTASHPDEGDAVIELPDAHCFGETGFSIGFNARYLREAVSGFDAPRVELHFSDDAEKRALCPIRLQNGDDWTTFAVVMPMRM